MQFGVISRFGAAGFGFIKPEDESPDVFFHIGECFLRNTLVNVGDRVLFELNQFSADRRACEVKVISDAERRRSHAG